MDSGSPARAPLPNWWSEGEAIAARELSEPIAILVEIVELIAERLGSAGCSRNEDFGIAKDLAVRVFVAEALSQLDAAIALLSVGCFDQIEPIARSTHELVVDLYLIINDEFAFDVWVNWQTVEAATLALQIGPGEMREGRDLVERQAELAGELRQRLRESHPEEEAKLAADAELSIVLRAYSTKRTGRRFPGSWRTEYQHESDITREGLIDRVAKGIWDVTTGGATVLLDEWGKFRGGIESQFGPMYNYWSGEIHNSPMAMGRKIDPRTLAPSVHGAADAVAAPIGAMVVQVFRIMAVFERLVCIDGDQQPREALMDRMQVWQETRGLSPPPFWFTDDSFVDSFDEADTPSQEGIPTDEATTS